MMDEDDGDADDDEDDEDDKVMCLQIDIGRSQCPNATIHKWDVAIIQSEECRRLQLSAMCGNLMRHVGPCRIRGLILMQA